MLIQILSFTGFQGSVNTESNTLTQESLSEVLRSVEVNPGDNSVVSYSYKTDVGRQTGDFTENTTINSNSVVITIQMRETKARHYSNEELVEVIEEAKSALASQEYKSLRSACRELSQVSTEVKEAVGNYTHYPISGLIAAVERALNILQPETTEVSNEQLTSILNHVELIDQKLKLAIADGNLQVDTLEKDITKIREDLAFVANHIGLILPNHPELYIA